MESSTIDQVIIESEKCLRDVMNTEKAVIYLVNEEKNCLLKYKLN
jgi:hypothetical protein